MCVHRAFANPTLGGCEPSVRVRLCLCLSTVTERATPATQPPPIFLHSGLMLAVSAVALLSPARQGCSPASSVAALGGHCWGAQGPGWGPSDRESGEAVLPLGQAWLGRTLRPTSHS